MLGKLSVSASHGPKSLVPNILIELSQEGMRAASADAVIYQFQEILPRQ